MINPDISDWERLRKEIPAVENSIDKAMAECHSIKLEVKKDAINPDHYTTGDVEAIDCMKASMSSESFRGHLKATAMKYLWRYETKHPDKPLQDLNKCKWYLERLIKEVKG
tara:strand:- start:1210 stop:1542 length:333 start_codon:yes stop_codon:yes gene_type:complete